MDRQTKKEAKRICKEILELYKKINELNQNKNKKV